MELSRLCEEQVGEGETQQDRVGRNAHQTDLYTDKSIRLAVRMYCVLNAEKMMQFQPSNTVIPGSHSVKSPMIKVKHSAHRYLAPLLGKMTTLPR